MKLTVIESGDTAFLPGEVVDREAFELANADVVADGGEAGIAGPSKLVRDKVPDQAKARDASQRIMVRTLDHDDFVAALADKLVEEGEEFRASLSLEELADVLEVVQTLADILASRKELERVRRIKARIRGGFRGRILMSWGE